MHRGIAWDKVENPDPQSTPQVLSSFEEYTMPATYPKEVKETLGILIEVEPLDETLLEDLGLNTYNHDIPLSSREIPSIDEPKPQRQPLPNCLSLNAHFKEATTSQTSLRQPKIENKPSQPEEPEPTLEDEFQDLHLNLPVLEVLAHTPIYNAILDKYIESLELGKNGSAFVQ
ncbi:hypothetical protein Tco_0901206 [Tanacetum coccineum]